jgi:uncharacterized protein YbaP (TraB family)
MKKAILWSLVTAVGLTAFSQESAKTDNTLLWRISGKNLQKPSYLFGTIHLLCGNDVKLSDSLQTAIRTTDKVYLELDMDNLMELMSVVTKMKMNGDTTLEDLLSPDEYKKVKTFFDDQGTLLPFSLLETYKPMLAASTLMQSSFDCENAVAMEQLVMKEAKRFGKSINGLETMSFQMSIFDSIPYSVQAKQLLQYVENYGKQDDSMFRDLSEAYKNQELKKLEELTNKDDSGIEGFNDILIYNRNQAWVEKLEKLMPENSLVVAVGAGHLPGKRGMIELLRKAGYTVEPVKNDMLKREPLKKREA